jgi:ankyrin repeat protein/mRNA-degrading endonuclease RelE of RelBE toxin-antitoxin system
VIKKVVLYMMTVFGCMVSLPMIAMISKPQHSAEEKQYTEEEENRQKVLGPQLLAACADQKISDVRRLLNDGADPNSIYAMNENGDTPLHIAVAHESLAMVKLLIEHDADMEAKNVQQNITPLFFACVPKDNYILEYMLDHGANVNARGPNGSTLLSMACYAGYPEKVTLLLNKGADVSLKDKKGRTALHFACKYKSPQIVKILLTKGADINAKSEGGTPLHFACFYRNDKVVQFLLQAGADFNIPVLDEFTPVDLACALNLTKIIPLFVYYGAVVKGQEEADKAMHAFFAELKKESVNAPKSKQNIKKVVQAKQPKKIKQKKQITNVESSPEELSELESVHPVYAETSTTSSTSTTAATSTVPKTVGVSLKKEELIKKEENVYSVVEGKHLKWPRSLRPNQEKLIEKDIRMLMYWPDHGLSDVKKLKGKTHAYRLRVGGYRILFSVDDITHVITIEAIDLRKNVYKNFNL